MAAMWVHHATKPINEDFRFGANIGMPGQYGRAVRATKVNPEDGEEGKEYAIKVISKRRFRSNSSFVKEKFQKVLDGFGQEVEVMRSMDHPNIIKYHAWYEDRESFYIVTELCTGGELYDRIKEMKRFSEKVAADILRQLFEAVNYMHSEKKCCHNDLKPDNCLFASGAEDAPLKLIDFGMAKILKPRKYFQQFCGTMYYIAPDVLNSKYDEAADLWSLGVITFVLLFGFPPFHASRAEKERAANAGMKDDTIILAKIRKGFDPTVRQGYGAWFPTNIGASDTARDFIAQLLVMDPLKRMTAREALEHPFLNGEASDKPIDPSVLKSLQEFQANNKFKLQLLETLVDRLSDTEMAALERSFSKLDSNNDGTVTFQELNDALKEQLPPEKIKQIFDNVDVDGNGHISYKELTMSVVQRKFTAKEARLAALFDELDKNADGTLNAEEIQEAVKKMSGGDTDLDMKEALDLIEQVDKNKDGRVQYEEFLDAWGAKYFDESAAIDIDKIPDDDVMAKPQPKEDKCCVVL